MKNTKTHHTKRPLQAFLLRLGTNARGLLASAAAAWLFIFSGVAHAQIFAPVDFSSQANFTWATRAETDPDGTTAIYMPSGPVGVVELGGVPFNLKSNAAGFQAWNGWMDGQPGQESITIPVGVQGVTTVYTLINTYWNLGGPSAAAWLIFTGSGGATYTKYLVGGSDIRNWIGGAINGTTTVNVYSFPNSPMEGQTAYLDMQTIVLPANFAKQTLTSIELVDNGAPGVQRVILDGVTVETGGGPAKAPFVSQGIDPLYAFTGANDGGNPAASLIQASDGDLYGTSSSGGAFGYGTVFRVSTNGFTALYSFTGRNDGANPAAGLLQARDGYLYGTTSNGGTNGYGTVFRIGTNGACVPLYSFTGGNDGANPTTSLLQASNGCLYGTTWDGGTNAAGTVFQISTNGAFTSIYSFTGGSDGANPAASLIQGADGCLYGSAQNGGTNVYWGTIFKLTTNGGFTLLHTCGYDDGGSPEAALLQANDGYLYGTTWNGGTNGAGTVFQISTNGAFTSLYSFNGQMDGANSSASLIQIAGGLLLGTVSRSGNAGQGTVFVINPTNAFFRALCSFTGDADGANPAAGLMQASNGNFYGTAANGGTSGSGTVFELDPLQILPRTFLVTVPPGGLSAQTNLAIINLGTAALNWVAANSPWLSFSTSNGMVPSGSTLNLTVRPTPAAVSLAPGVYSAGLVFTNLSDGAAQSVPTTLQILLSPLAPLPGSAGANPDSPLIQAGDGNLYGTTVAGGTNGQGSIVRVGATGTLTTLYSFSGGTGAAPEAALVQAANGLLYGTTCNGGTNGAGTVFQISTNGAFVPLYSFTGGNDGANPTASLLQARDGYLYGTTWDGGTNGAGTVFRISTNGAFTSIYSFTGGNDGANPAASLIQGADGYLYGTAQNGGTNVYWGTIFKLSTKGDFILLHTCGYDDGGSPEAALLQASDGNFYGTTWNGGTHGCGTVFQISAAGTFTSLYSFTDQNDGANSSASLIQAANGDLYGTTCWGGISGFGTVFQITPTGNFTSLYSFSGGEDGGNPAGALLAFDGYLYGMSQAGGTNGNGTVFALVIPQVPITIGNIAYSHGKLSFSFPTVSSQNYIVQRNTNLATGVWVWYTNCVGNDLPFQVTVPVTNSPAGYFRVTEQ